MMGNNKREKWISRCVSILVLLVLLLSAAVSACSESAAPDDPVPEKASETLSGAYPMPAPAGSAAPGLDADGFLDADEPYIYADRDAGEWTYLSRNIHIEIRQEKEVSKKGSQVWLIAAIRYREPAWFGAMVNDSTKENSKKNKTFLSKPLTIYKNNEAVFAISDDFFGSRLLDKKKAGIVIRNGKIWSESTQPGNGKKWPALDVLAQFADGTWKTFESDAHTAQEYLDMGVVSTYAFGPILVENGQVSEDMKNWKDTEKAPRLALGIAADGTLVAVDALGRRKDSTGVTVARMASKMVELGVKDAFNLDGGNTTCMIFMGDMINHTLKVSNESIRSVNSLIGIRETTP